MGKRKSKDPNYLKKKIRKLENKLRKLPQHLEESTSEADESLGQPSMRLTPAPTPSHTVVNEGPIPDMDIETETEINKENDQLPEDFLLALGKEGEEKEVLGDPIRTELVLRWTKIMSEGIGKEFRNNLIEKYPTPSNFQNAVAPEMNPEILATLSETSVKRDKRIVTRQNLTGKLMTCLGRSLTSILKGDINSKILIEQINDAAKIAGEIHFQDSSSRNFFALSGANKIVQEAVKNSKIDKFLFGTDCPDKIKAAQSIQKTSTQISDVKKNKGSTTRKQLNWRGPPQNNRPRQQQVRGGQFQQQQYKKQPRFNRSHQTDRKQPPVKSKPKYYH